MHQVGAGVLGPVFRAYDPDADRTVAVKSFPLVLTPEQADEFAAALERLTQLPLSHPSIVAPLASGVEGSTAYLVEDYFVAESVDVALRQYGPAPVADALRLIGQLAGALDFAAVAGVHHGLLHARDILVAPHEVRLTGLGIAEALESVGFKAAPRRPYSAPERVAGRPWGTQADVYSLAVVAIELLTGRRAAIPVGGGVPDLQGIMAADRAALDEAFGRALSERPEDRFPTALAFASALKHALAGAPLEESGEAARPRKAKPGRGPGRSDVPVLPLAEGEPSDGVLVRAGEDGEGEALPSYLEPTAPSEPQSSPGAPPPDSTASSGSEDGIVLGADTSEVAPRTPPADERPAFDPPTEKVSPAAADSLAASRRRAARRLDRPAPPPRDSRDPLVYGRPVPEAVPAPEPDVVPGPPPEQGLDLAELDLRPDETEPATEPEVRRAAPSVAPAAAPAPVSLLAQDDEVTPPRDPNFDTAPAARRRGLPLSQVAVLVLLGVLTGMAAGYYFAASRTASQGPGPSANATSEPDLRASGTPPSNPTPVSEPEVRPETPTAGSNPSAGGTANQPGSGAGSAPSSPSRPAASSDRPSSVVAPPSSSAQPTPSPRTESPRRETRRSTARPAPRQAAPTGARSGAASRGATAAGKTETRPVKFEGSLVIVSRPPGASVRIDGHPVGTTPMTMAALSAGAHAVRLEREGYRTWSASVQVIAGRQNRVSASLDRQ